MIRTVSGNSQAVEDRRGKSHSSNLGFSQKLKAPLITLGPELTSQFFFFLFFIQSK